jgi:hypothetical protein
MKKNPNYRVGHSPITGQIFAGTVLKNGLWSENRYDVTDSAFGAVAQALLSRDESFTFQIKDKKYIMTVKEIIETPKQE